MYIWKTSSEYNLIDLTPPPPSPLVNYNSPDPTF